MKAPGFWFDPSARILPALLAPAAAVYAATTARRMQRPGWRAPVPVICCGNAGAGGAGKTTLALDLGARLLRRQRRVAFLTRGYGGRVRGTARVRPGDDPDRVGDEPLLLAAVAPTYAGADRAASARAAVSDGADVLVMDDGLQNPTLHKSLSLLVVDGTVGFGNGRVIPAGPLREPVTAAVVRCASVVLIGDDSRTIAARVQARILRASLRSRFPESGLGDTPIHPFAGIAHPEKFFASLRAAGAVLRGGTAFPDHHRYSAADLDRVLAAAARDGAVAVTTPKDAVRLPPGYGAKVQSIGVDLVWDDAREIEAVLDQALAG